jgi:hypothetical protein
MEYPEEVLTKSKKGKIEVRAIIDRGEFVRYEYLDPATGKKSENKVKLVLRNEKGEQEEYFIIPLKQQGKFLLLKAEVKGERKLWDREKKMVVKLFANEK